MTKPVKNKSTPTPPSSQQSFPLVSVCTPTFNRRPFIPIIIQCFRNQTYPLHRMEWIIVDDGTDPIEDVLKEQAEDLKSVIRYFRLPEKMSLGKKRNFMHDQTKGDMIVYMDDDDYYPPLRVAHSVETLTKNPQALCAGSSVIFVFYKHIQKMIEFGPYGPNHSTAGTFAFRRKLLDITRYDDTACLAEERHFLKDYTIPFAQMDPYKTILVFSHEHNTFDKKKLLTFGGPCMKEAPHVSVSDFICLEKELPIKQFFLQRIDNLLKEYHPGESKFKPDVLKQTLELEKKRAEMTEQMQKQQQQQPVLTLQSSNGEPPVHINMDQIIQILKNHEEMIVRLQEVIQQHRQYIEHQAEYIEMLKKVLPEKAVDPIKSEKAETPKTEAISGMGKGFIPNHPFPKETNQSPFIVPLSKTTPPNRPMDFGISRNKSDPEIRPTSFVL